MESFDPDRIAIMVVGAYGDICNYLLRLPIPIRLPSVADEQAHPGTAATAVDRARETIWDLPLEPVTADLIDLLLLEWRTAVEQIAVLNVTGPAKHRVDAVNRTMYRLALQAELVEATLPA
ncbi:hypothetical protein [Nonomuraea aridisoli]|uniref:Uncharacterized protein n=1 Tax=Nonomuraea aridisoli TaxID=2070368 RepID=A0A2W2DUV4_9ACTN|nr:hypothetical protein [Nonomuraea aridisoli]PZG08915.1 hypothetical protein C1J01_38380 [Nonomuraea aridisoli]